MDKIIVPHTPVEVTEEVISNEGADTTITHQESEKPLEMTNYIKELWQVGEAENHFEMKTLLQEINDFVLSEIDRNKMESNKKSYGEIIKNYEKKLGLPDGIDIYSKTESLLELMNIDKKLLQAVKEKEEFMAKPITELTSAQLKKRLEMI